MIAGARTLAIMLHRRLSDGLARARRSPAVADLERQRQRADRALRDRHTVGAPRVGDLVVVTPPEPLASFLADRGYLPRGVPLVKHVAALAGQSVCRNGLTVSVDAVDGRRSARARQSRPSAALSGRAAASSRRAKSSS